MITKVSKHLLALIVLCFPVSLQAADLISKDIKSFSDGTAIRFSTAGHPKAKGLALDVRYPPSWRAAEGERPNVVQKFVSERGKGLEVCTLVIKSLPYVPSEAEVLELFDPKSLPDLIPSGAQFIDGKPTQIDGQPAAYIRAVRESQYAGLALRSIDVHYFLLWKDRLAIFQCTVGAPAKVSLEEHAARFDYLYPLFTQMALSIVVQSKWK